MKFLFCRKRNKAGDILKVESLVELLVHSEVNANELGFSGLSPKILFYKRVKW